MAIIFFFTFAIPFGELGRRTFAGQFEMGLCGTAARDAPSHRLRGEGWGEG
jgi:hypothetical protein